VGNGDHRRIAVNSRTLEEAASSARSAVGQVQPADASRGCTVAAEGIPGSSSGALLSTVGDHLAGALTSWRTAAEGYAKAPGPRRHALRGRRGRSYRGDERCEHPRGSADEVTRDPGGGQGLAWADVRRWRSEDVEAGGDAFKALAEDLENPQDEMDQANAANWLGAAATAAAVTRQGLMLDLETAGPDPRAGPSVDRGRQRRHRQACRRLHSGPDLHRPRHRHLRPQHVRPP
jgi:hypothetical protein